MTSQLRISLRMPSTSWRKLPNWSSLRRRRNFRSERTLMILVDPDQPLLKPSMSQLQLTKCSEGGQFQIKAWHSNSQEVDQTSGERYTDLLGHKWDKQEDTFALKKDSVVRKKEDFTKRSCLALLAQVWDPIGLVAPVTIKYRIDLQELWSTGYGWDDILPVAIEAAGWKLAMRSSYCQALCCPAETENCSPT